MRTIVLRVGLAAAMAASALVAGVAHAAAAPACRSRVLVLSAFPAELGPLLEAAEVDHRRTVEVDGRHFYVSRLRGNDAVLALTGIGLVNAEHATEDAINTFACRGGGIRAVVFSGVAGGPYIGDVTVPQRWTEDGRRFVAADARLLALARRVTPTTPLERTTPTGDPACACVDPDLVRTVRLPHAPQVRIGGDGISTDPFGGKRFLCVPSGGDIFGCEPCREQTHQASQVPRFVGTALPFVGPGFIESYFASPPVTDPHYVAQDMETAAVATVAARHHLPFLGFRAASDGNGDPLMLPGFPFQFFVYRQLAADNAAAVALRFLGALRVGSISG